ncbi:MAG: hypothetical protein ACHWZW_20730 [Spirulina sp.]
MSLHHSLLKASLGFGFVGLVGLTLLSNTPIRPAVAATSPSAPGMTAQSNQNPSNNDVLSQGRGQGRGQGQVPGACQGQGPRGERFNEHVAEAAAELGVTEDALRSALGVPDQRPERPDLATAAAELGTTEDELRETMHNFMQTQRQERQGQGPQAGPPDFTALAQQYGVSEAEFRRIMGIPDRPDFAAAAAQLGVSEDALREALRPDNRGRGPAGAPGQGRGPSGNPGNSGNSGGGR